jgi:hypothetical protein
MRKLLIGLSLFFVLGGVALAWPYRLEQVAGTVAGGATRCAIDVQNYSGWHGATLAPGIGSDRVVDPIDAYAFVDACPGAAQGRPAALTLIGPGIRLAGEDCGMPRRDGHVCRVRIPAAAPAGAVPLRYRLLVQPSAGGPVQTIDLDVGRRRSWRSATLDALMSV